MQVDPMKPTLRPPGIERLKRNCDILLSTSAFKVKLRRYTKGGKSLPTIILPHGGPHASCAAGFVSTVAYLASLGYAVVYCNYRGSTGYGERQGCHPTTAPSFIPQGHSSELQAVCPWSC